MGPAWWAALSSPGTKVRAVLAVAKGRVIWCAHTCALLPFTPPPPFSSPYSTVHATGTRLDSNAKTWRLMADVINDCALFLEFISPSFPGYFLLLACTANVAKVCGKKRRARLRCVQWENRGRGMKSFAQFDLNIIWNGRLMSTIDVAASTILFSCLFLRGQSIVGVAGGVTRTVITNHQARNNNVADVAAKDGSQETAVSLVGMLLGMAVVMVVTASPNTTCAPVVCASVCECVCVCVSE